MNGSVNKREVQMKNKTILYKITISIIVVLCLCSTFIFNEQFYKLLNPKISYVEGLIEQSAAQIHFIDVGQGDAIAIRLPDNKKMLIDCGTPDSSEKLVKYLKNKFFKPDEDLIFDIFLITHPHQDHIGGGKEIFDNFQINSFYRPPVYLEEETFDDVSFVYSTDAFKEIISKSKNEPNCNVVFFEQDTMIEGADYSFQLFMQSELIYDANNFSPLILFNCFNKKVVFTGDMESDAEEQILLAYGDMLCDIDILKVAHHGSTTSSSTDFLETLTPVYSVISVGRFNESTIQVRQL